MPKATKLRHSTSILLLLFALVTYACPDPSPQPIADARLDGGADANVDGAVEARVGAAQDSQMADSTADARIDAAQDSQLTDGGTSAATLISYSARIRAGHRSWFERCYAGAFVRGIGIGSIGSSAEDAAIAESVLAGRVRFDRSEADACIALLSGPCNFERDFAQFGAQIPACDAAFRGTVAADGACHEDLDCVSGMCIAGSATRCPGRCAANLAAGERCVSNAACANGLVCFAQYCVPPIADGGECGVGASAVALPSQENCMSGSVCVAPVSRGPRCAPRQATQELGEECMTNGVYCRPGLVCADSNAGPNVRGRCIAPFASSAACQITFPEGCPEGQYCNGSQCTALPTENQACGEGAGDPRCALGLICDGTRCRRLLAIGESCDWDGCEDGSCIGSRCIAARNFCSRE